MSHKHQLISQIESGITIRKGSYKRTPVGFRIAYQVQHENRLITAATSLEVAEFSVLHQLAKCYSVDKSGSVKMFKQTFIATSGHRGVSVQMERLVQVFLDDFLFTDEELKHIAAVHEYERAAAAMGIGEAATKVVTMVKNFLRVAA